MGDYSKGLSCSEKVIDMEERTLCTDHPPLANAYQRLGSVCLAMSNYPSALFNRQKAIAHLRFAALYPAMGSIYFELKDASNAPLQSYEKALTIGPSPNLATSLNNIGLVNCRMDGKSLTLIAMRSRRIIDVSLPITVTWGQPSLALVIMIFSKNNA